MKSYQLFFTSKQHINGVEIRHATYKLEPTTFQMCLNCGRYLMNCENVVYAYFIEFIDSIAHSYYRFKKDSNLIICERFQDYE